MLCEGFEYMACSRNVSYGARAPGGCKPCVTDKPSINSRKLPPVDLEAGAVAPPNGRFTTASGFEDRVKSPFATFRAERTSVLNSCKSVALMSESPVRGSVLKLATRRRVTGV
jgi:hypothetical protein